MNFGAQTGKRSLLTQQSNQLELFSSSKRHLELLIQRRLKHSLMLGSSPKDIKMALAIFKWKSPNKGKLLFLNLEIWKATRS
jgi:hypothetical protein